jgi:hypothetical protein
MSQLRQTLLAIEQGNINEGSKGIGGQVIDKIGDVVTHGWKGLTGQAAKEALIKELGEKVVIKQKSGEELIFQLEKDGTYHLKDPVRTPDTELKYSPEQMKDIKDRFDPPKEPRLDPETTEPHPILLGPDGKPLQVPAKPKPAITDPVVKAIADVPISTDVPEIVNMGSLYQYFSEHKPEELKKLAQNPTANKRFWNAVTEKSKSNKGKIAIAALIALLIWYLWPSNQKEKDSTANAGGKTSEDGSATIGTVIPGDEMNWLIINAGNLAGQSITKGEDGVWKAEKGATATDPAVIKKIEEIAKQSPEQRKQILDNQNNFSVYLSGGGSDPDITTSSTPVPTTTWGLR